MADEQGRLNRRQFLSFMGLGGGAAWLAGGRVTAALAAAAESVSKGGKLAPAFGIPPEPHPVADPPIISQIRGRLQPLFEGNEMALDFRRINDQGAEDFRIQINSHEIYPVASAFKAFLILYYFMYTPLDEWQYDSNSTVYRVAVYSNNYLTGVLMHETSQRVSGEGNAVEKFNNFLISVLGMQQGMYSWNWPSAPTVGYFDNRFLPTEVREVHVRTMEERVPNVSTATDMATGWAFIAQAEQNLLWQTPQFQNAILATREILSIPADVYRSPIEKVLYGGYIGKDGTLPVGDLEIGRVINDAGIIRAEDGQYVVAFMSAGEIEQSTEPALFAVIESIRVYQDYLHPRQEIVLSGDSYRIVPNQYNHGLVRYSHVPLFIEPREDALFVDNPVRRSSTFGTPYLMQGAMVRFWPLDDHWGRIIWDDDEDDVFTYTDWTFGFEDANWNQWNMFTRPDVYVRIDDLLLLGPRHTFPIDYVTDVDNPVDKFMILYVPRRQLTLFEGVTPILKTPIVLNLDATPRGRVYVNRVLLGRNMPNYPGVPYTNFLHDGGELNQGGYAVHGSPWHLWNETVTEWETIRRYSHGCINLPNWSVPIGNYELPVDEFIFRWIGGFPRPGQDTVYFTQQTVRLLSLTNPYAEVYDYSIFDTMRFTNTRWEDILRVWEEKPIDAPERFFINPYNRDNAALLRLDAPTGENDQTES